MAVISSNPVEAIRDIVDEHETDHVSGAEEVQCRCMERISYVMQVFYPVGVEFVMSDDELADYEESERDPSE